MQGTGCSIHAMETLLGEGVNPKFEASVRTGAIVSHKMNLYSAM